MILPLTQSSSPTFKARVTTFWEWYVNVAERFLETIERGECPTLAAEVGDFVSRTLPHLSWVFGPGEGGGHSFTITGEGFVPDQLLAEYCCDCAPDIPGWTFHASRQPSASEHLKDFCISFGDAVTVNADEFLLSTSVDDESELIDLVAWHPAYTELDKDDQLQVLYLLLDEALGEFGTQTWIGNIKVRPIESGERKISLVELPEFIGHVNAYHQWKKLPPLRSYSLYQLTDQTDKPRGDTVVGSTVIPDVVFDLIDCDGKLLENPLEGTGAEFAYLAIDSDVFPEGQQSDVRGNMEDAIDDALGDQDSGRTLGGAFGIRQTYIDLLLFDGDDSRRIIDDTLRHLQLGGRYRWHAFA